MKIYKITEASEYLGVSTTPNLDEIKHGGGASEITARVKRKHGPALPTTVVN